VICVGVKHLKVFGPIVVRNVVLVMNNLCRQEPPAKHLLRNKAMLTDIAITACVWMIRPV
jgi:hypothetical protein